MKHLIIVLSLACCSAGMAHDWFAVSDDATCGKVDRGFIMFEMQQCISGRDGDKSQFLTFSCPGYGDGVAVLAPTRQECRRAAKILKAAKTEFPQ